MTLSAPISALADFIASTDVPQDVLAMGQAPIADCFGCMLAGAESQVATDILKVQTSHSQGGVHVYGTGEKLTAPAAALVLGVTAHAWDLDDWEEPGNTHPTAVILPSLLVAAELAAQKDHKVTGTEMLTAYAIGVEVIMRLGEAISLNHYARGFHSTATLGAVGAAAATARLLSLTTDQTVHALGLSVSGAAGYTVQFGTHAKSMQAGMAARAGLEAALNAKAGVTSNPETVLHKRGFAGLMGIHNTAAQNVMITRLGNPWALHEWGVVLKPWPSCGYTHRMMTAAIDLRDQLKGRLDTITAIEATTIDFHYAILPFHQPATRLQALFSLPACTAQMLCHGRLTLEDSAAGFWLDDQVLKLIDRTHVVAEPAQRPDLNYDPDQPDRLCITLADGDVLEASAAYPLGSPQKQMSQAQMASKYADITHRQEHEFDQLMGLGHTKDINKFFLEISA